MSKITNFKEMRIRSYLGMGGAWDKWRTTTGGYEVFCEGDRNVLYLTVMIFGYYFNAFLKTEFYILNR